MNYIKQIAFAPWTTIYNRFVIWKRERERKKPTLHTHGNLYRWF